MKKQMLNTGDNDTLNSLADTGNYGGQHALTGDPKIPGSSNDDEDDEDEDDDVSIDEDYSEDKPLPGEIANPEELDENDEMA